MTDPPDYTKLPTRYTAHPIPSLALPEDAPVIVLRTDKGNCWCRFAVPAQPPATEGTFVAALGWIAEKDLY